MLFILSRSPLLGGGVVFRFREFFSTEDVVPSKVALGAHVSFSLIGKVFRQQQLLWPYCCCCAGRLRVLREGNERRVYNRINQDECEQQLLVPVSYTHLTLPTKA